MKMLRKQLIPDYKKYPEKVLQFGSGNLFFAGFC
jgi:mannitol-1-phosphate/altronate dehydrogenase